MSKIFLLAFVIFASGPAMAQEPVYAVRSEMRTWIDRVDELIGGKRADDNRTSSTLRLNINDEVSRDVRLTWPKLQVGFAIKLGRVEDWEDDINHWINTRLDKIKTSFWKDEHSLFSESDTSTHLETHPASSTPHGAHLPAEKDPWRFTVGNHVGIAIHPSIDVYSRLRKDYEYDRLLNSFSVELGWSNSNRWESTYALVTSTALAPRWTLSFGNSASWSISAKTYSSSHGPTLAYVPGELQVLTLSCSVGATLAHGGWTADSYSINTGYRLAAWRDWLFVSVNPFLNFNRVSRFYGDPGTSANLEIVL